MALSVTVPCLLRKSNQPFLVEVKKVFKTHREVILTSSVIIAVTIYLALTLYPEIQPLLSGLSGSVNTPSVSNFEPVIVSSDNFPSQLRNLLQLR